MLVVETIAVGALFVGLVELVELASILDVLALVRTRHQMFIRFTFTLRVKRKRRREDRKLRARRRRTGGELGRFTASVNVNTKKRP